MNDLQSSNVPPTRLDSIINYIKAKKLLFLLIPFGILIIFLLLYSTIPSPQSNTQPAQITPQNATYAPPTTTPATPSPVVPVSLDNPEISWSPKSFSEDDFQSVNFQKTQLSDGSIKYTYPSSNINRPNEIIVKNGTVIYQRSVITGKYVYNYTGSLDAPDYNFQGSRFYGGNTTVYVYLKTGTAFVADPDTTLVREQINFQPMNIEDFKKKYGEDIVDFTVIPTLPEE